MGRWKDAREGLTYEDYVLSQDEVLRRATAIKDRLARMEFTASTFHGPADKALTAVGALYAALTALIETGVSLSLVNQLTGFLYMVAEDMAEDAANELLDEVRKSLLMRGPTHKGRVM